MDLTIKSILDIRGPLVFILFGNSSPMVGRTRSAFVEKKGSGEDRRAFGTGATPEL